MKIFRRVSRCKSLLKSRKSVHNRISKMMERIVKMPIMIIRKIALASI